MDSAPGKKNNTAQNDQKPHGASSNERRHLSQGEEVASQWGNRARRRAWNPCVDPVYQAGPEGTL